LGAFWDLSLGDLCILSGNHRTFQDLAAALRFLRNVASSFSEQPRSNESTLLRTLSDFSRSSSSNLRFVEGATEAAGAKKKASMETESKLQHKPSACTTETRMAPADKSESFAKRERN